VKRTVLDAVRTWGVYQPDRHIDFNGFLWVRPGQNVLIDPMPLDPHHAAELSEAGGAQWIVVTNAEHLRAAPEIAEKFRARIVAPAEERPRLGNAAQRIHHWFETAADLPVELRDDVEVFSIRGGKSPMEPALWLKPLCALYFGDVVRSHVSGALTLLPAPKLADRDAVVESLQPLGELPVDVVLLGDGDSLFTGAREAFRAFLAAL
jgi:glyoxylase-like metal-dependent hydrolase (beta-lactamase superfamily II)